MNFLKTLFKKKMTVTFHLKSGRKIPVKCHKFESETQNNELVSYTISEMDANNKVPYLRIHDVSAITIKK